MLTRIEGSQCIYIDTGRLVERWNRAEVGWTRGKKLTFVLKKTPKALFTKY